MDSREAEGSKNLRVALTAEGLSKTRRMMFMYIILLKKILRFAVILVFELGHFEFLAEKSKNRKFSIGFSMKISKIENFSKNRKSKIEIFDFQIFDFSKFFNENFSIFRFFDFFENFDFLKFSLKIQWKIFDFPIFRQKIQNDLTF